MAPEEKEKQPCGLEYLTEVRKEQANMDSNFLSPLVGSLSFAGSLLMGMAITVQTGGSLNYSTAEFIGYMGVSAVASFTAGYFTFKKSFKSSLAKAAKKDASFQKTYPSLCALVVDDKKYNDEVFRKEVLNKLPHHYQNALLLERFNAKLQQGDMAEVQRMEEEVFPSEASNNIARRYAQKVVETFLDGLTADKLIAYFPLLQEKHLERICRWDSGTGRGMTSAEAVARDSRISANTQKELLSSLGFTYFGLNNFPEAERLWKETENIDAIKNGLLPRYQELGNHLQAGKLFAYLSEVEASS